MKYFLLVFAFALTSLIGCREIEEALPQNASDYRISRYRVNYEGAPLIPQFSVKFNLDVGRDVLANQVSRIKKMYYNALRYQDVHNVREVVSSLRLFAYPSPEDGHRHIVECALLNEETQEIECTIDIPQKVFNGRGTYPVVIKGKQKVVMDDDTEDSPTRFNIVFPATLDLLTATATGKIYNFNESGAKVEASSDDTDGDKVKNSDDQCPEEGEVWIGGDPNVVDDGVADGCLGQFNEDISNPPGEGGGGACQLNPNAMHVSLFGWGTFAFALLWLFIRRK